MPAEFLRDDRHVYRHVAGEHLLVALHRDRVAPMFALTPTGAAIWERLERWSTAEALVDHLAERFDDVPRAAVSSDVAYFLDQLEQIGAVRRRDVTE